jgi:hypothetical protein
MRGGEAGAGLGLAEALGSEGCVAAAGDATDEDGAMRTAAAAEAAPTTVLVEAECGADRAGAEGPVRCELCDEGMGFGRASP